MEIRILGPIGVFTADRQVALGGRRQRAVLAGLLVHVNQPVSTDRLIDFVWGDDPPPTARKSLQTYVSRLRRLLGATVIEGYADGYLLRLDGIQLDADQFEKLAEQGRSHLATDPQSAFEELGSALAQWRGSPLSDIHAGVDLVPYLERLSEARLAALEDRLEAGLALGRHGELVGELKALVEAHPLRERLWEQLMLALYRSGREGEALRAFQRCRKILGQELGIEPSPALQRVEERVLLRDPELDLDLPLRAIPGDSMPSRNPYKGLRAFSEADASDFFGREALVAELVARIDSGGRFLALVGPSGSGKSSVALAGLVPAVRPSTRRPARLVATMTPGTHPFAQLEAALAKASPDQPRPVAIEPSDHLALLRVVLTLAPDEATEVLLVIDQFEELLTGAIDEKSVTNFVRNLAEAVEDPHGQLTVVVTLRADFFDRALRFPDLAELLAGGVVNVPPLSPTEIQAAVVRPAQAVGLEIEPELAAELVSETAHQPGSLPLLQFVLTELTDRASGRILTLAALHEAGGIRGTLARQSEELYKSLSKMGKEAARRIFLRLASLDETGNAIRRTVAVDDLHFSGIGNEAVKQAIDGLVKGRLLTYSRETGSGRSTIEVAHEAVFREWPRCARWIDDARSDIRQAEELERAAADWMAAERSPDYLLTGTRLRVVEEWARSTELGVTPTGMALLEASLQRRDDDEHAEAARVEREKTMERRAVNRLRVSVAILALLAVVTTGLSVYAAGRSREADRQGAAALAAATEILVRQLSFAAVAESGRDPELSLLLALHAVRVASVRDEPIHAETVEALHWGLQGLGVQYPVSDGDSLVLIGTEGRRGAYHLPWLELVALARSNVTRQLTPEECGAYLSSGECPVLPADIEWEPPSEIGVRTGGPETLAGTTVRVVSPHFDHEADGLRAEFEAFTNVTAIEVAYTSVDTEHRSVDWHRRTDIILVPQPGWVLEEAAQARLMDLGRYLDRGQVVSDYGPYLVSWGTVGLAGEFPSESGHLYAVPVTANLKSLIWYVPERFAEAGFGIPTTWDELIELSDRIVSVGGTPWCFAEESGIHSGWPATDWVEDLLLKEFGPEVYDSWVSRDIPFSHPRVRKAFERLGQLFFTDGYVHGGTTTALGTPVWAGPFPLFDDPPGCWLYHQASFMAGFVPPGVQPGEDVAAFPTPSIADEHRDAVVGGGDYLLVYTDRPEVRALVKHMAGPSFGRHFAEIYPGFLAANRRFDTDWYPDEWRQTAAAALAKAQVEDRLRFDGSDLMPPWLGAFPFWSAMIEYLNGGPDILDEILATLDALEDPETSQ